jgi:hypothetical protein
MSSTDRRKTHFRGAKPPETELDTGCQETEISSLVILTGIGRGRLPFRAMAPSVECPMDVEATYSMRSSLWQCQGALVLESKCQGELTGMRLL